MTAEPYSLGSYVDDLRRITRETNDEGEIIGRVRPLARRLTLDKDWLQPHH